MQSLKVLSAYFLICLYILYVAYPPPAIVPPNKTGTAIIPTNVVVIVIDLIVANALDLYSRIGYQKSQKNLWTYNRLSASCIDRFEESIEPELALASDEVYPIYILEI